MVDGSLLGRENLLQQPSIARALRSTLGAAVAASVAIAALALVLKWTLIAQLALIAAAAAAAGLALFRLGLVRLGIFVALGGVVHAVIHAAAKNDGIQSIGIAILPALIVFASLVVGSRALVGFTVSALIATATMLAIRYHLLRIEPYTTNQLGDFLIFAVICATAAMVGRTLSVGIATGIQQERDRLSAVIASITDEVWFTDANSKLILVNPAVIRGFGLGDADEIDVEKLATSLEVFRPDGTPRHVDETPSVRALKGQTITNEEEIVRIPETGERRYRQVNAAPVRNVTGGIIGSVSVVRDITESKRTEHALLHQNKFIQAVLENTCDGVVACDGDGNLALFNRAAREWHGIDALKLPPDQWSSHYDLFGPDGTTPLATESIPLRRAFNGEQLQDVAMTIAAKGQPVRHVLASARPFYDDQGRKLGAVAGMHDITERKQAEAEQKRLWAELAHAQKMESVGRLAGGIAHDFNNLMSVVLMHADSALEELQSGASAVESVTAIRDAADRAISLGRQLMTFSQKEVLQTEFLDLASVVEENQKLIRRLIGEDVKVVFKPGPRLAVKGDRGQLGQILVNLAVNSRDAMPRGGTFSVQTCQMDLAEGASHLHPAAKPGSYAMLKVGDNGIGMDAETRARAFEPFFTTKGVGKGTGLGLSVVYGIVSRMGGFITVESQQDKGTEFGIYLPIASGNAQLTSEAGEEFGKGGSETVLLAEDEPALREKIRQVLAKAGYRVLVAVDGDQAVQLSLENPGPIHLLVTDVVMPEISGYRLAENLQSRYPRIKVLYMSGYPNPGQETPPSQLESNFIHKPFTKAKLLRRVREVLDTGDVDT